MIKHMRKEEFTDDEVRVFQIYFLGHADICE
jgi:hypothetical protein